MRIRHHQSPQPALNDRLADFRRHRPSPSSIGDTACLVDTTAAAQRLRAWHCLLQHAVLRRTASLSRLLAGSTWLSSKQVSCLLCPNS